MRKIDRNLEYKDGKLVATTTRVEHMDKGLLFRELERCAFEQQNLLITMRDAKQQYLRSKEEEAEYKEALKYIDEHENEIQDIDLGILDDIEEI